MKDQVAGRRQLIVLLAVVVGLPIPSTLETQFWTDLDGRADPMTPVDCILCVLGGVARTLSFLVVKEITAE